MTISTTTTLNDLIPAIVAEAMFVASERSIMRGLVKNYTLPMQSGKTVTVPIYPIQTASAVSEGTDLSSGNVATSGATLTVSEVGIMTKVADLAAMTAQSDVIADVGRLFGEAIARKMDKDLIALFDGFSTSVGGANVEIGASTIFNAVARLKATGVSTDGIVCVLSPAQAYDVKKALTNTFANPAAGLLQNEAMQMGYVGMLAGIPIFESANVEGTNDVYKGAVFHRDALGLAMLRDINIELQRDASLRATEVIATAVYGVGELYDSYGVEVHSLADLG